MQAKPIRHSWQLLYRVYRYILPLLEQEFAYWYKRAEQIPDEELRKQATASMNSKKFHCQGGSVYATQVLDHKEIVVPLIVAYQTISDYLDNLCDRSTSLDPVDFRQLHYSMQDALTPGAPLRDYYMYRDEKEDGGFLAGLVLRCQEMAGKLASYGQVQEEILTLSVLYSDLQVHKHIAKDKREAALFAWWDSYQDKYPEIRWQEFGAATGSTVGIFALFCLATQTEIEKSEVDALLNAYFPWIGGVHILLDYLIDLEEDKEGGDLNFVSYYHSDEEAYERLQFIIERAKESIAQLPHPQFHRLIVDGLIAFYLVDEKVNKQQPQIYMIAKRLLKKASGFTSILFYVNSMVVRRQ
ncbi:tetraprenyl-beta-curcumene synthase family protein [Brevibacillus daliensis]|uniref:tetraprenyl-beta-curcumene synthase family protein n=1 Tax=Brevibacillus daliensis TaxID=2892995 RepID=UPI001E57B35F|nr:tetraprenyl-beta-curcumene synthase family protein [Brevibacillus daliensis]